MTRALDALRRPAVAATLDAVLIVVFAAVGRASHEEGNPVVGALATAWPFLLGAAVGWLVVRVLRRSWPLGVGPGITVWFGALVFGMLLRRVTGEGTAVSFIIVAALVLALFLLGWRAVAALLLRRQRNQPTTRATSSP